MTAKWPVIRATVETVFAAAHSLPDLGQPEMHSHIYRVRAGWTHEINPRFGITDTMGSMKLDLETACRPLVNADLNKVLGPWVPTAEIMALWILERLSGAWMFVEIHCYDGYEVRVEAGTLPAWKRAQA